MARISLKMGHQGQPEVGQRSSLMLICTVKYIKWGIIGKISFSEVQYDRFLSNYYLQIAGVKAPFLFPVYGFIILSSMQ